LSYRELGFPLEEIATLLDDPHADATAHLRRQHRLLTGRVARLQEMVAAVERAMEAEKMGITLTPEERFELFGDFVPEDYAKEAQARWGGSDAWEQSQRRTSSYTNEDWVQIKAESAGIEQGLTSAMAGGLPAGSEPAMDLAEAHREHLARWFYVADHDLHRGLGEMYVSDPRFTAYYEAVAPGLATYVRDAIVANADRAPAG
jgi:DNA-binding transcriptional MerR regulator